MEQTFPQGLQPGRRTCTEAEQWENEGMVKISCYRLILIFHSPSPSIKGWEVEESGNKGVKLSVREKGGQGIYVVWILSNK